MIVSVDKERSTATKTFYNLSVICKEDVPAFGPIIPNPPVFEKGTQFRNFLFTKLINAELAAYDAPAFTEKFKLTRTRVLDYLEKSYLQK